MVGFEEQGSERFSSKKRWISVRENRAVRSATLRRIFRSATCLSKVRRLQSNSWQVSRVLKKGLPACQARYVLHSSSSWASRPDPLASFGSSGITPEIRSDLIATATAASRVANSGPLIQAGPRFG